MTQTSPRFLPVGCAAIYLFMYAPLLVLIVFSLTPTEYGVTPESNVMPLPTIAIFPFDRRAGL